MTARDYVKHRIRRDAPQNCFVIPQSTPIISFGDWSKAAVVTVGANPGKSSFLISGVLTAQYFPTLVSLGRQTLASLSDAEVETVVSACIGYFHRNHHRGWFGHLERILAGVGASYYDDSACHLDLIQWATSKNWTRLTKAVQRQLLKQDAHFFKEQLEHGPEVRLLLVNGNSAIIAIRVAFGLSLPEVRPPLVVDGMTTRFFTGAFPVGDAKRAVSVVGWSSNIGGGQWGVSDKLRNGIAQRVQQLSGWQHGQSD